MATTAEHEAMIVACIGEGVGHGPVREWPVTGEGLGIVLGRGEFHEVGRIPGATGEGLQRGDDILQGNALAPQGLRPLRVIPDARFRQLQLDFRQSFPAAIEVKDTP